MKLELKSITKNNWEECIELKVSKIQEHFVASNVYSLAEVQFLENFEAKAIYKEHTMVGFAMFGLDPDDDNYWIYRLMIDEQFQGQGYGKKGLIAVVEYLMSKEDCQLIMVGYHPENTSAKKLYESVGFHSKGKAPWGEELAGYTRI